jgi:hypothetical protein
MHWIAMVGMENAVVALGKRFRAAVRLRQIQILRRTRDLLLARLLTVQVNLRTN